MNGKAIQDNGKGGSRMHGDWISDLHKVNDRR